MYESTGGHEQRIDKFSPLSLSRVEEPAMGRPVLPPWYNAYGFCSQTLKCLPGAEPVLFGHCSGSMCVCMEVPAWSSACVLCKASVIVKR